MVFGKASGSNRMFKSKGHNKTMPQMREASGGLNNSASGLSESNSCFFNSSSGGSEPVFYLYLKDQAVDKSECRDDDSDPDFKPMP